MFICTALHEFANLVIGNWCLVFGSGIGALGGQVISVEVYQFVPSPEMTRVVSNTSEVEVDGADVELDWIGDFVEQDPDIGE